VCAVVQDVLKDKAFVAKHLGDDVPERKVLYEDPTLGFCILAPREPRREGVEPSRSRHHLGDLRPGRGLHGDDRLGGAEPAAADKPGKVRVRGSYPLEPGMAHVYNEGDVHSPRRDGPTRLIRIEGQNTDRIKRYPYEKA
jgi:hypothetical protein